MTPWERRLASMRPPLSSSPSPSSTATRGRGRPGAGELGAEHGERHRGGLGGRHTRVGSLTGVHRVHYYDHINFREVHMDGAQKIIPVTQVKKELLEIVTGAEALNG